MKKKIYKNINNTHHVYIEWSIKIFRKCSYFLFIHLFIFNPANIPAMLLLLEENNDLLSVLVGNAT